MSEEIRLTRDIYNFVRGKLKWEESLQLLNEIVDYEEWLNHLVIDMLFTIWHSNIGNYKKDSSHSFESHNGTSHQVVTTWINRSTLYNCAILKQSGNNERLCITIVLPR